MATFQGLGHSRDEILNMNHHSRKLLFVQWWAIRCYSSFHGRSVFVTLSCSGSVACRTGVIGPQRYQVEVQQKEGPALTFLGFTKKASVKEPQKALPCA